MGDDGERSPLLGRTPLKKGQGVACVALLAVEGLERAAFFGIAANLVLYLTGGTFGWGGTQASCACLLFLGGSYLLSPVGGWLADVYLGRYATVVISFFLYLLAASLLPVTAWPDGRLSVCGQLPAVTIQNCSQHRGGTCRGQPPEQYCAPTIYTGLLLLALGVSSLRANLTPFGADQVSVGQPVASFSPPPLPKRPWTWGGLPSPSAEPRWVGSPMGWRRCGCTSIDHLWAPWDILARGKEGGKKGGDGWDGVWDGGGMGHGGCGRVVGQGMKQEP